MHTYERNTRVNAPFETVWGFHSTEAGLEARTPGWLHLDVESVRGPSGDLDSDELEPGATVRASIRPFGVGPRQRWTSEIVERDRSAGAGFFRETMHDGPFEQWEHTHLFYADGEGMVVRDGVVYELPAGQLNRVFGPFAIVGFEPMFHYWHRQIRSLLEGR